MPDGETFPSLPPHFCTKYLLSVLPVLHRPLSTLFHTLWHCNHNTDPTKTLSFHPENTDCLRVGSEDLSEPLACTLLPWSTRLHLLGN